MDQKTSNDELEEDADGNYFFKKEAIWQIRLPQIESHAAALNPILYQRKNPGSQGVANVQFRRRF